MYKKMLIPLDGSDFAEAILKYAKSIACNMEGVDIYLLHVYSQDERGLIPKHRAYIEWAADAIRKYPKMIKKGRGEIACHVNVKCELASGKPADEILRYADNNGIDLILMATHGRSGINRWAMGSVAYKVLRSANVPVWLARDGVAEEILEDRLPERKILVPLDGSKLAESVLPHVESLAKQWGGGKVKIVLLRAYQPPDVSADYPSDMPLSWEEHVELEAAKCKLVVGPYLAHIEKRFQDAGLKVHKEAPLGKPDEEIINYARDNKVSLVTMITHGRSGISRWAYGSVAEDVMLKAYVPVFLVRG
ncbi:MAG TPA: universal stress protein [Dehalococcoidia bacterium]|nr:universal stress protein [Dehalococcoidia bacterium]